MAASEADYKKRINTIIIFFAPVVGVTAPISPVIVKPPGKHL
jgi:hypothetical protein